MQKKIKPEYRKIWSLARPYLNTRSNEIHTRISLEMALGLMEKEGGDETVIAPAIILHDVGWSCVPEDLLLQSFGPHTASPELNRIHEVEGKKIAEKILAHTRYPAGKKDEILKIVDYHDSGTCPISVNDKIVKDADKLWRYTESGFTIDTDRFGETLDQGVKRLQNMLHDIFFTATAERWAEEELNRRKMEVRHSSGESSDTPSVKT